MPKGFLRAAAAATLTAVVATGAAAQDLDVRILYLERRLPPPPVLSNLDPVPADLGLAGARLGIADSNTTGRFLGHAYALEEAVVEEGEDLAAIAGSLLGGFDLVVADMPADDILALADLPGAADALILNATAPDDRLRREDCRANVLHTLPSRAMRADALAQVLVKKRWEDLFLIVGPRPGDQAFAEAVRKAADKYGLDVLVDKDWPFAADMRRNAAREVPPFTQEGSYDVVVVADEARDFGRYVAYNTWLPRPVAGTEGLVPTAWSRVVEQWGAAQLQKRFEDLAGRSMQAEDYAAWAAVRSIAEAVTRTGEAGAGAVRDYLLSDAFELAAFKGRAVTFRDWNGQMRQPVPVVQPDALVAQPPLEGFLHPVSEMDTLGYDRRAAGCTAFGD